jgi:hypothetical protein
VLCPFPTATVVQALNSAASVPLRFCCRLNHGLLGSVSLSHRQCSLSVRLKHARSAIPKAISSRAGKSSRIPILGEKRQLFTSPAIIGSGSGEKASTPNPAHFDVVSLLPLSIPSNGRPRLPPPAARGSLAPCALARRSRTAEGSDSLHARCRERRGIARVANAVAAEIQARIDRETVRSCGGTGRGPQRGADARPAGGRHPQATRGASSEQGQASAVALVTLNCGNA